MSENIKRYEDELTLKEMILKIQEYIRVLIKNWWVIGLSCLIFSSIFLYKHYSKDLTYGASLKFVVEGQTGSGGGISSLLGSIGLNKGGGGKTNPFKILEVARGSTLFLEVLSHEVEGQLLANKLLEVYDLPAKWAEDGPEYADFRFDSIGQLDNTNILRQKVLKRLQGFVLGSSGDNSKALTKLSLEEDSGIYTLQSATIDESLTLALTEFFYEEIKYFFEEEVFANQRQIAEILDAKADSLQALRDYKAMELARFEDQNRAIIGKNVIARRAIMTMENRIINEAYAKIFAQREMTDINRKDQQPLFVAIERPFKPLSPAGSSLKRNLILGIGIGSFLSIVFLLLRKIYRDVMK